MARRRNALLEAAARLIPLHQGKLDNLCGLYSILNAIRLASWPLLEFHHFCSKRLFHHAIALLEEEGLLGRVLQEGMDEAIWCWLCNELVRSAGDLGAFKLARSSIFGKVGKDETRAALSLIDHHTKLGRPVLVALRGGYNHYTVIVEVRNRRLMLFDSFGYQWVSVDSCELERRKRRKRHQIGHSAAIIRRIA